MDQVYLFGVASRRTEWLSHRQTIVAENVANANTPGYTAKDLKSFNEAMEATRLELAGAGPMHLAGGGGRAASHGIDIEESWDVLHSGNSVSVEQEMLKAGQISHEFSLNTAVVKAFHRMLIMSVKG